LVAAQQELESKNRGLWAQVGASERAHRHVREQVKPAEAVVATQREPIHQELYNKIREVVGLARPEEFLSDQVKNKQACYIREREYLEYPQGRDPTLEEDNGERKNRSRKD
jgi:hypothetical protein